MTSPEAFPHIEPEGRLYRTQDRGLSATLFTLGFPLIGIERPSNDLCYFAFPWSEDLNCAVVSYWTDQLVVHPRALIRALNEMQRMTEARVQREDMIDASCIQP